MDLTPLPAAYTETRDTLHVVATHVLARARHASTGKFGLRGLTGGFGTPAFGPSHMVLRVSQGVLLRETTGVTSEAAVLSLGEVTLADVAAFAAVDLSAPFSVGHDTPPVGDTERQLHVDPVAGTALGAWYSYVGLVLDTVLMTLPVEPPPAPTVAQLWPEHFDIGLDLHVGTGRRTNLGGSPGDGFHPEPYLYVGPWDADRPGGAEYWNAPFGALATYAELRSAPDPLDAGRRFVEEGLARLRR
jgi:hypothetical protein